jgi:hypothetical protein
MSCLAIFVVDGRQDGRILPPCLHSKSGLIHATNIHLFYFPFYTWTRNCTRTRTQFHFHPPSHSYSHSHPFQPQIYTHSTSHRNAPPKTQHYHSSETSAQQTPYHTIRSRSISPQSTTQPVPGTAVFSIQTIHTPHRIGPEETCPGRLGRAGPGLAGLGGTKQRGSSDTNHPHPDSAQTCSAWTPFTRQQKLRWNWMFLRQRRLCACQSRVVDRAGLRFGVRRLGGWVLSG